LLGRRTIRRAGAGHRAIRARRTTDIAARLMGQWLSERLGQQFVIENRPGASTTIGHVE
jgi:hypothetical protein